MFQTILGAIKLSMAEARQLDRTAHVASVGDGSCEVIHGRVAALDECGGNQRHPPAHKIDWDNVETLCFVRGKLAEESAKKVRERCRGVDALVPAQERLCDRRFNDSGAHDSDGRRGVSIEEISD